MMSMTCHFGGGSTNMAWCWHFQLRQLIDILRWMCELGQIDISAKVSMLSFNSAIPHDGHLEAEFHVFSFLKVKVIWVSFLTQKSLKWGNLTLWDVIGMTLIQVNQGFPLWRGCDSTNVHRYQSCWWQSEPMHKNQICHILNHGMIDWL